MCLTPLFTTDPGADVWAKSATTDKETFPLAFRRGSSPETAHSLQDRGGRHPGAQQKAEPKGK